ncbi:unnamed protein product [Microthlaspi erraticum]|uniref:Uncharacterized protein n=1 Tax=Microthlaspi erraticum TaxID=1685480 RepID=A0A6D2KB92_9BRAS|nr:unnamed protein product [Microthlaspi erraticum]
MRGRALRNDQKWCSLNRDKGKTQTKRAQPHDSGDVGPREEQEEERPIGVKASKAAKLRGSKTVKRTTKTGGCYEEPPSRGCSKSEGVH